MNNQEINPPIPMVDLKTQYLNLKNEIQSAINNVLESSAFILGPNVHAFENEIAKYLDIKHAISCASGTDALHLALHALELSPGDEVIVPSFTFAATAEAIRYVDATPVFVDIDPNTFNIDPLSVQKAITNKTRAVIIVHLFGLPANVDAIKNVIENKDIFIVEDCAQSFGACINQQKTGTFGDIACFSFFPSKNLGAYGDGGLITTTNDILAEKIKLLRNHGSSQRYQHDIIGYNSRLDEIQAAVLRIKLRHIDDFNQQRRAVATLYTSAFDGLDLQTPKEFQNYLHVFHQYTLLSSQRNEIISALNKANIASAIYYPSGLHLQNAFKNFKPETQLPATERVSTQCFSLPMYPELSSQQVERIINVVNSTIN